jgi:type II secretory pathway component PulK
VIPIQHNRRGTALIFVLYLLLTLGLVTAEVARSARAEAAKVAGVRARSVGRYAAESGIAVAMVRVHQLLDSAVTPASQVTALRGVAIDLAQLGDTMLGSARFRVTVVNLNARIDLNRAPKEMLERFLGQFAGLQQVNAAVAALGKEPVRRVGELARVSGMSQSLAYAVAPYVTTWSDGMVDINAAPETVLVALQGMDPAEAQSLVQRREAGEVFTSPDPTRARRDVSTEPETMEEARGSVPIPQAIVAPSRLLLISRGWQDGQPLTHEIQAAYAIVGHRLVLQAWAERDL